MTSLANWLRRPLESFVEMAETKLVRMLEEKHDYHLIKRHYYSPVPDAADHGPGYWDETSSMPGVDLGLERGLSILQDVVPAHIDGFRARFPLHQEAGQDFFLLNGTYMAIDAHVYWCLIHHHRPRRIVEIGAHASTMVSTTAVESGGQECLITVIEPYPSDFLMREDGRTIKLLTKKVQDVELALFQELEAGDILFIDSTHVLREGSDVQYEYLEILPRLKPGVLVHFHDISLPRRYPKVYFDNKMFWNEQYLLQAFLAFNSRFDVIWAGNAMMLSHEDRMRQTFPEFDDMRAIYPSSEPTAFWVQSRQ